MPKTFRGDENYVQAFEDAVVSMLEVNIEDREERMQVVEVLIEEYIAQIGKRPKAEMIEKLTDYILHEELADKNPHKVAHTEYPFLSGKQMDLRWDREFSWGRAKEYDSNGVNRAVPIRRRRTLKESIFMDDMARKKNRRMKAQYRRDTSAGEVVTYYVDVKV